MIVSSVGSISFVSSVSSVSSVFSFRHLLRRHPPLSCDSNRLQEDEMIKRMQLIIT